MLIWIREWRYLMGVHLSCYMLHVKRSRGRLHGFGLGVALFDRSPLVLLHVVRKKMKRKPLWIWIREWHYSRGVHLCCNMLSVKR